MIGFNELVQHTDTFSLIQASKPNYEPAGPGDLVKYVWCVTYHSWHLQPLSE